jgi:N-acetylated-alpha-linked acidic dipeptidase
VCGCVWVCVVCHSRRYSPSGEVEGALLYANYGRPEDLEALDRLGVDVRGRVVLMRYGRCFRGLKVMNAQKRGAAAVVLFSDPADDGFGVGPTYPAGPWRPESGVQRGSVQFLSLCPGDPVRAQAGGAHTVEEVRCQKRAVGWCAPA